MRMLNEDELQEIKETMETLGEVMPFTSSSDSAISVRQQSVEIDVTGEASSARVSLEDGDGERKKGGDEEREGDIRSILRRLTEENFV